MDNNIEFQKLYVELFLKDYYNKDFDKYVFSLSKNSDSLTLWNYYAKGNGYNIAIDIENLIKENQKEHEIIKVDIVYDSHKQAAILDSFFKNQKTNYNRYNEIINTMRTSDAVLDFDKLDAKLYSIREIFTEEIKDLGYEYKHPAYKNEEEIRLIIRPRKKNREYKVSDIGTFIEFVEIKIDPNFDIQHVKIHPLSNSSHKKGVERFLADAIKNKALKVKESVIPFRSI